MLINELLDQGVQYPAELGGTIDLQSARASCCKFNRWGSLVAVGSTDGWVFICDFSTQKVVETFQAHSLQILTLSWSRDGRRLLTASADKTVKIWNVLAATLPLEEFAYTNAILCAYFNPRNTDQLVVLTNGQPPHVETINPRATRTTKLLVPTDTVIDDDDDGVHAVSYDRRGRYIITGTSKGRLVIYSAKTFEVVTWVKQSTSLTIRQIYIPRRGNYILTNAADRVVRVFELDMLLKLSIGSTAEHINKFSDNINQVAWKVVCTDEGCNYICSAGTKSQQLYIWERETDRLVHVLDGVKGEMLLDVQWHPTRPIILSISNGLIYIWTRDLDANLSAWMPGFRQLEENAKYRETEGDFDEYDEDASVEVKIEIEEDEDIDVTSFKPSELVCSSDEDDDVASLVPDMTFQKGPLWFLPAPPSTAADFEDPEQQAQDKLSSLGLELAPPRRYK